MKTLYFSFQRKGILSFLLLSVITIESFSQAPTTCSSVPTACVGTQETFTGGPNGFSGTAGGFAYSNNALVVASTDPNTNYPILSRSFTLAGVPIINVGFTTAGTTANLSSYTVEVLRASDNTVLASCVTNGPAAGPICYTIADADLVAGLVVIYRITIRTAGGNNATVVFDDFTWLQVQQGPLPVRFSSFTATRNDTRVQLKWQTATEANNRLFEVQRKTTKNDFEVIASVPSKAQNGNSTALLNYEFEDANNFRGQSQYRIRQVDLDGKSTYSVIRIVGNNAGERILVYPNPSRNGAVSVTFNSNEARQIDLVDNTGRVIKQWNAYTAQDLKIDKLSIGVYLLKTKNLQTSEQDIQRIVVSQ